MKREAPNCRLILQLFLGFLFLWAPPLLGRAQDSPSQPETTLSVRVKTRGKGLTVRSQEDVATVIGSIPNGQSVRLDPDYLLGLLQSTDTGTRKSFLSQPACQIFGKSWKNLHQTEKVVLPNQNSGLYVYHFVGVLIDVKDENGQVIGTKKGRMALEFLEAEFNCDEVAKSIAERALPCLNGCYLKNTEEALLSQDIAEVVSHFIDPEHQINYQEESLALLEAATSLCNQPSDLLPKEEVSEVPETKIKTDDEIEDDIENRSDPIKLDPRLTAPVIELEPIIVSVTSEPKVKEKPLLSLSLQNTCAAMGGSDSNFSFLDQLELQNEFLKIEQEGGNNPLAYVTQIFIDQYSTEMFEKMITPSNLLKSVCSGFIPRPEQLDCQREAAKLLLLEGNCVHEGHAPYSRELITSYLRSKEMSERVLLPMLVGLNSIESWTSAQLEELNKCRKNENNSFRTVEAQHVCMSRILEGNRQKELEKRYQAYLDYSVVILPGGLGVDRRTSENWIAGSGSGGSELDHLIEGLSESKKAVNEMTRVSKLYFDESESRSNAYNSLGKLWGKGLIIYKHSDPDPSLPNLFGAQQPGSLSIEIQSSNLLVTHTPNEIAQHLAHENLHAEDYIIGKAHSGFRYSLSDGYFMNQPEFCNGKDLTSCRKSHPDFWPQVVNPRSPAAWSDRGHKYYEDPIEYAAYPGYELIRIYSGIGRGYRCRNQSTEKIFQETEKAFLGEVISPACSQWRH